MNMLILIMTGKWTILMNYKNVLIINEEQSLSLNGAELGA